MGRFTGLIILCVSILFFLGCNNSNVDEKKFFDLYTEILIIRADEADTTISNPKVRELFIRNNYSQEQFKADFTKLSENNKEQYFAKKIDSIRKHVHNMYNKRTQQ